MKRLFLPLSLVVVVSIALAACTGGGVRAEPTAALTETPVVTETLVAPTVAPTEAPTEQPIAAPTEEPTPELPPTPAAPGPTAWTCPEGEQKVSLWHGWQGEHLASIEDVFNAYMEACPNVTIELVSKTDLSNVLTAAVPAGEGPDIFDWVNYQIGRLAEAGIIIPLTPYIDKSRFATTFIPTAVDAVTYGGEIYGYPESMEAITMIYNKDLISEEELPKTTDELLEKAKNWDKSDYYFVYNARNDAYFSAAWWQAAGVTIVDEEGNTTFKSPEGYAAGNFIKALRDNNVIPEEIDYGIADTLFRGGRAAIIVNGPWYIEDLNTASINYGLALLPVFSPSNTPGMPFVDTKALMLTRNAQDRGTTGAAVNVLQYYTSPEAQAYLAKANEMVPTNKAAVDRPDVQAIPVIKAFAAQAANGKPMPLTPYMGALWDPMAKGIECIWTGGGTVEECVDRLQTMAEETIAEMR